MTLITLRYALSVSWINRGRNTARSHAARRTSQAFQRALARSAGTKLPSQDRWQWFDLIGDREFEQARCALPVLFGQGEDGVGLVIGLTAHFLRLGIALEQGRKGLEAALPVHQKWLARRVAEQAKRWTLAQIDHALAGLLDVDRLLKASPHTDEHFVESWLLGLRVYSEAA